VSEGGSQITEEAFEQNIIIEQQQIFSGSNTEYQDLKNNSRISCSPPSGYTVSSQLAFHRPSTV
jgi:hypothetical protein